MKRRAIQIRLTVGSVIAFAAGVTLVYLMSILFGMQIEWILGLWLASGGAIVWMAIRILKDPSTTDKTFDDYFYQDREDIRRNGKE